MAAVTLSQDGVQAKELWHSFDGSSHAVLSGWDRPPNLHSPRPPLVLIHGLLGYSFSWRHNFEELAHAREAYAVDLLGIGYSDRPRRGSVDLGLHATAERLLEWLQALGLRNVDLLGTSHGGAVAMMMAALERENGSGTAIGRLVLAAPANPWSHLGATRIAFLGSSLRTVDSRTVAAALEMGTPGRTLGSAEPHVR